MKNKNWLLSNQSLDEWFTCRIFQNLNQISGTLIIYPPQHLYNKTPQESNRSRQSKNKFSRCLSLGNKGEIDSPSDSDGFGEEAIYSPESPKRDEIFRDFDWEKNRFAYILKKKTLLLGKIHNNLYYILLHVYDEAKF